MVLCSSCFYWIIFGVAGGDEGDGFGRVARGGPALLRGNIDHFAAELVN